MVPHVERKTQAGGVWKKGVGKDIWVQEGRVKGRGVDWMGVHKGEIDRLLSSPKYVRLIKKSKTDGALGTYLEGIVAYKDLVENPE